MDYERTAAILKALGHPARLKMAEGIAKYGCHVNKMVEHLGLPQSTVSQHLAALRASGVVSFEKKGARRCYRLTHKNLNTLLKMLRELA